MSLIRRDVADLLQLPGHAKTLCMAVAAGGVFESKERGVFFQLRHAEAEYRTPPLYAVTVKNPAAPSLPVNLDPHVFHWLAHVKFTYDYPEDKSKVIHLILNSSDTVAIQRGIIHSPRHYGPRALITMLGNALMGSHEEGGPRTHRLSFVNTVDIDLEALQDFMSAEQLGTDDGTVSELTADEQAALEMHEELTSYDPATKSYKTGLLWKLDPVTHLDSNMPRALAVCRSFKKKALKSPELSDAVDAAYMEQLERGMAVAVPPERVFLERPSYVIPTHPVFKPSSTSTKVRIVHNASSKCPTTNHSLNDCLYAGPNLLPDISMLMLQFRTARHFIVFDVSKMFWRINIRQEDTPFLRYLWQFGRTGTEPIRLLESTVLTFGVIHSPFSSMGTLHMHARNFAAQFPAGSEAILKRTYVDDGSGLSNDRSEIVTLGKEMYELLWLASMIPHKWNASEVEILEEAGIPEDLRANTDEQPYLGLRWRRHGDMLCFDYSDILSHKGVPTKRSLLSETAKVYDPLGMISPFIVGPKILFQRTWQLELGWDEPLPDEIKKPWEEWRKEVAEMITIRLPRLMSRPEAKPWLAVFADASLKACAAVAYAVGADGGQLIFSKTKVAPIRPSQKESQNPPLTIARMELLAAVMGVRIATHIQKALPDYFTHVCYFTDSLITLYRIKRGNGHYKQFVANRLKEIEAKSSSDDHYFVPGMLNPADSGSRSVSLRELRENMLWWNGPDFLRFPREQWPEQRALSRAEAEKFMGEADFHSAEREEVLGQPVSYISQTKAILSGITAWAEPLLIRYNKWRPLVRASAILFRFLRSKISPSSKLGVWFAQLSGALDYQEDLEKLQAGYKRTAPYLTVADWKLAEGFWLRVAQRQVFQKAFDHEDDPGAYCNLMSHRPFIDSAGLLRSTSRLTSSELIARSTVYPLILPAKNAIVHMYITFVHESMGHLAKKSVFAVLSTRFKVMGGRREVNSILSRCPNRICNPPRPLRQPWAPLPTSRTDNYVAFSNVACDFFGPLKPIHRCHHAKCPHAGQVTAYGCIFTCLYTRAVALEVVFSLKTSEFMQALLNVGNRFGFPSVIYSDNAKTFQAADRELKKLFKTIDPKDLSAESAKRGVEWRWGLQRAPHTNGVVERMVGVAKRTLKATFGKEALTESHLRNAFLEAERVINDRPLGVQLESGDYSPLSPSLLIHGRELGQLQLFDPKEGSEAAIPSITRLFAHRRRLQAHFWKKWQTEYLLDAQATKFVRNKAEPNLKVDQVVLLRETTKHRNEWRLARITALVPGPDGLVRQVHVRVPSGLILIRHVKDLALLECDRPVAERSESGGEKPGHSMRTRGKASRDLG